MRGGSKNPFTLCVKEAHTRASFEGSFLSFAVWYGQVTESWVGAHEQDSTQLSVQVYIVSNVTGQCLQVSAQVWE